MGACRHRRACARLAPALPFLPADLAGWLGAMFVLALALVAWAIVTITRAGSNVPTNLPTTAIVESGPYRFTRNPIYLGMFLGLIGLAIVFVNLWLLMVLVPFALVICYGVVAREAYLAQVQDITVATARAHGAGCSALLIDLRPAAHSYLPIMSERSGPARPRSCKLFLDTGLGCATPLLLKAFKSARLPEEPLHA